MDALRREYLESRDQLRELIKRKRLALKSCAIEDVTLLDRELKLLMSMHRDINETIELMQRSFADLKTYNKKLIFVDPIKLNHYIQHRLSTTNEDDNEDIDTETAIKHFVVSQLKQVIRQRLDILTIKQRDTVRRWIYENKNISDIAKEDGVSRQAIWIRLFGDKTNQGAIKKMKG